MVNFFSFYILFERKIKSFKTFCAKNRVVFDSAILLIYKNENSTDLKDTISLKSYDKAEEIKKEKGESIEILSSNNLLESNIGEKKKRYMFKLKNTLQGFFFLWHI